MFQLKKILHSSQFIYIKKYFFNIFKRKFLKFCLYYTVENSPPTHRVGTNNFMRQFVYIYFVLLFYKVDKIQSVRVNKKKLLSKAFISPNLPKLY